MTNAVQSKNAEIVVYLGLGSNLGDREANLRETIERIKGLGLKIKRESSVYETEPVGFTDQPWFLNQVIETRLLATTFPEHLDPQTIAAGRAAALLSELLRIEQQMGRERLVANGPRLIDIDLLLFGDVIVGHSKGSLDHLKASEERLFRNQSGIVVPHPRMHLRRFVLEPLCELAPNMVHPVLKKTVRELLPTLDDVSRVRIYGKAR